jgi:hypothetical protein
MVTITEQNREAAIKQYQENLGKISAHLEKIAITYSELHALSVRMLLGYVAIQTANFN